MPFFFIFRALFYSFGVASSMRVTCMAVSFLSFVTNILFPGTCLLCQHASRRDLDLCKPCEHDLPWLKQVCSQCALILPNPYTQSDSFLRVGAEGQAAGVYTKIHEDGELPMAATPKNEARRVYSVLCGNCLNHPPPFLETRALFHYQHEISYLLTALKFNHQLAIARTMGHLMADHLINHLNTFPDYVIPMPLHPSRLRERGFNQALELARPLAKQLKIPLEIKACQRIRSTAAQTSINRCQRAENVKNAFLIDPAFSANYVAILDDVVTTGHTVSALAEALVQYNVKRVDVWCCARTQK